MVQEEGSLCPRCGGLVIEDNCPQCDFRFSSILVCPYKKTDKTCGINGLPCHIDDLGWEACEVRFNQQ